MNPETIGVFGKLLGALEGPISLLLLLVAMVLAGVVVLLYRQTLALQAKLDRLMEARLEDARRAAPVLDQLAASMAALESQVRQARSSPIGDRLEVLIEHLERGQRRSRASGGG